MSDKDLKELQKKVDVAQGEVVELEQAIAVLTDKRHTPASLGDSLLLDFLKSEFSAVAPELERQQKLKIAEETLHHARKRLSERKDEYEAAMLEADCQRIEIEVSKQRDKVLRAQEVFRRELESFEALAHKHGDRWTKGRRSELYWKQQVPENYRFPTFTPTESGAMLVPYAQAQNLVSW